MHPSIEAIQEQLVAQSIDGWLLYVYRDRNPVADQVLGLPPKQHRTRRAFYWIPATGEAVRLEHRIENRTFSSLPGTRRSYLSYTSLEAELKRLLSGSKRVAMEYSPKGMLHTMSFVDAGTLELVSQHVGDVVSSAPLVQYFVSRLTPEQIESHRQAAERVRDIARGAFRLVEEALTAARPITEEDVQQHILDQFAEAGMITDHPPIVARGAHAGNPHYDPKGNLARIEPNQLLLIDLWAKADKPGAVYADQTWMAFTGGEIPKEIQTAWNVVRDARRAAKNLVSARFAVNKPVYGWEVDEIARKRITEAGLGDNFVHRLGHSITDEVHGPGANLDNLETREERPLIPGTLMSVEPGVYTLKWGIRSENNLVIDHSGEVWVADGTDQDEIFRMKVEG
jgi:Xaa-Pro dipeptidase